MAALAALSAIATIVGLLFKLSINGIWPWVILVGILFGCILYASLMTRVKRRVSIKLSERWTVDIQEGNLFSSGEVVAIPVNEFFDTRADDIIIAKKSIHGQFIQRYFSRNPSDLAKTIEKSLEKVTPIGKVDRGKGLPQSQYELGTCADVTIGSKVFVLFVLTHFDENNHCNLTFEEYPVVTAKLVSHLESIANLRTVSIPLYGTGQSGLNKSSQNVLSYLLNSLSFISPKSFPAGFSIVLQDMKKNGIDLRVIH